MSIAELTPLLNVCNIKSESSVNVQGTGVAASLKPGRSEFIEGLKTAETHRVTNYSKKCEESRKENVTS